MRKGIESDQSLFTTHLALELTISATRSAITVKPKCEFGLPDSVAFVAMLRATSTYAQFSISSCCLKLRKRKLVK
jgi:hypothetical protein